MKACLLCGAEGRERFRKSGFTVRRCGACDLEWADPIPSDEELARVYASGYFAGDGHGYGDYFGKERAVSDEKARARMDALERCGLRAGQRVLDLGCADGRFVLEARRRGHDAWGVEVSAEARANVDESVRGFVRASVDDVEGAFDALTAFDVLEHLRNPLEMVRSMAPRLTAGALGAVVVPVIDNVTARVAPRWWDQYKPPEHLWYFSRRAMRSLLARSLGARVLLEACAWRRDARFVEGVLGRRGALSRVEGALWRAALPSRWREDSALFVAQVPA